MCQSSERVAAAATTAGSGAPALEEVRRFTHSHEGWSSAATGSPFLAFGFWNSHAGKAVMTIFTSLVAIVAWVNKQLDWPHDLQRYSGLHQCVLDHELGVHYCSRFSKNGYAL